jgi:predicted secreted protein
LYNTPISQKKVTMKRIWWLLLIPIILFAYSDDRALKLKTWKNEQRVALVIGTSDYASEYFSDLRNPVNDARAVRDVLKSRGFKVYYGENTTRREMKSLIKQFTAPLADGGVGLFYFAGHGIQVGGKNYLIASDSKITEKEEVEFDTIALDYITKKMENTRSRFNIVILDACRNDPFTRGGNGGLAPTDAEGFFIAYATKAGSVAKDGKGQNGLFTKHLIRYMQEPITVHQVLKKTRQAVYKESSKDQFPTVYDQSLGDFFFTLPDSTAQSAQQASRPEPVQAALPKQPAAVTTKNYNKVAPLPQPVRPVSQTSVIPPSDGDLITQAKSIYQAYLEGRISEDRTINLKAPEIASNGALVPIDVSVNNPRISKLWLFVDRNPDPFAGMASMASQTQPLQQFSTRLKMLQTGNIIVITQRYDGTLAYHSTMVKVAIGGMGSSTASQYTSTQPSNVTAIGSSIHQASRSTTPKIKIKMRKKRLKMLVSSPMKPDDFIERVVFNKQGQTFLTIHMTPNISMNPYLRLNHELLDGTVNVTVTTTDGSTATIDAKSR